VRVLAIDQRLSVQRLARLEDLAVPVSPDGGRIQAQHARERQLTA